MGIILPVVIPFLWLAPVGWHRDPILWIVLVGTVLCWIRDPLLVIRAAGTLLVVWAFTFVSRHGLSGFVGLGGTNALP